MKRALLLALLVGLAACGDSGTTTTLPGTAPPPPASTVTTTMPPSSTTTAPSESTTTTEPPVTEAPPPGDATARFAITQVAFGESAFVQISNIGNGSGELGGHWLCQRPVYFEIPPIELGPGQSVWIAADGDDLQFVGNVVGVVDAQGRIGSLAVTTGEIALYRSNDFSNADAIVDYVEWGTAGHGRSSVASAAGIWPEGGFVATTDDTIAITAGGGADDPEGWAVDIGV